MKKRIRKLAALMLAAGLAFSGRGNVSAKTLTSEDYIPSPNSSNVPVVTEENSGGLKKAQSIPETYMNQLSDLMIRYPGTRNQGGYDTCWAFSAIGLAEFDLITDDEIADKNIDLSELQVAYFTYHNTEDAFGGTAGDALTILDASKNYLTIGGNLDYSSRTLLQWQGVTEEDVAPYSRALFSRSLSSEDAFDKDVAHLQNVYIINLHKNADLVKKEIMNHGSAGIGLYMDRVLTYKGSATYEKTGEQVATYYCPQKQTANHAVNIVGWDDDFPAEAFSNRPAGNVAWLCRNSWSGETGNTIPSYFWLSYYDASLEDAAWIFDFEPADNYDFNYQYDGGELVGDGLLQDQKTKKIIHFSQGANVFKVQGAGNEMLEAVSLTMTKSANVPYTIKIFTNLSNPSKPKSGVLAAKVSGKTTYAGTNTIRLPKSVSVPKGSYYSVVVELDKTNTGLDYEYAVWGQDLRSKVSCEKNQSFVYYGGKWIDMESLSKKNGIGNLCIKAFTKKTGTSLSAVKDIKASAVSKNTMKISWGKTSGVSGYEIYRATNKNGTYKKVATTTARSLKIKNTSKTTCYYRVRAYKNSGSKHVVGKFSGCVTVKK